MSGCKSYRFGAGRYLQEIGLLETASAELSRYGTKAYIVAGPTSLAATEGRLLSGLNSSGFAYILDVYDGYPSFVKVDQIKQSIDESGCDLVVAVGGGRIMDLAKAVAFPANLPIVAIPTSCATCASFSPLSVMYFDDGSFDQYLHFDGELDAVLVDDKVMACQPARLLSAGIMDAMAKYVEIANGKPALSLEEDGIAKLSAFHMARDIYDILDKHGLQAFDDVQNHCSTPLVHDVVFACIALTGLVSSIMRAKGQTAVAHRMYESLRTHYFQECANYLHGEIVATGLIPQLLYNENPQELEKITASLRAFGMPLNLRDLGLDGSEQTVEFLADQICGTESVPRDPEHRQRLVHALSAIR